MFWKTEEILSSFFPVRLTVCFQYKYLEICIVFFYIKRGQSDLFPSFLKTSLPVLRLFLKYDHSGRGPCKAKAWSGCLKPPLSNLPSEAAWIWCRRLFGGLRENRLLLLRVPAPNPNTPARLPMSAFLYLHTHKSIFHTKHQPNNDIQLLIETFEMVRHCVYSLVTGVEVQDC